jgi:hypothetical protein
MKGGVMRMTRGHIAVMLLAAAALVSGCVTTGFQPYTGNTGLNVTGMRPYEYKGLELALPSGWKETKKLKVDQTFTMRGSHGVQFERSGGTGSILVYCWKGLVGGGTKGFEQLENIAKSSVRESFPDNEIIVGPYDVGGGKSGLGPVFEGYKAKAVYKGTNVKMRAYSAWKGGFGMGCKYTVTAFSSDEEGDALFEDFMALVRSLD